MGLRGDAYILLIRRHLFNLSSYKEGPENWHPDSWFSLGRLLNHRADLDWVIKGFQDVFWVFCRGLIPGGDAIPAEHEALPGAAEPGVPPLAPLVFPVGSPPRSRAPARTEVPSAPGESC